MQFSNGLRRDLWKTAHNKNGPQTRERSVHQISFQITWISSCSTLELSSPAPHYYENPSCGTWKECAPPFLQTATVHGKLYARRCWWSAAPYQQLKGTHCKSDTKLKKCLALDIKEALNHPVANVLNGCSYLSCRRHFPGTLTLLSLLFADKGITSQ